MPETPFFFVHVVESPSNHDLLDGRTEGRVLIESLMLAQTPVTYNLVTDHGTLKVALEDRLLKAWSTHQKLPIIHLSIHGNNDGVCLTNREFLSWRQLRELLLPINKGMHGSLIVCLSACYGFAGCRMAMHASQPLPFFALVGHLANATWSDSAVAFVTFYHLLAKGKQLPEAVEAMKAASSDPRFGLAIGDSVQKDWITYLRENEKMQEAVRQLLGIDQ